MCTPWLCVQISQAVVRGDRDRAGRSDRAVREVRAVVGRGDERATPERRPVPDIGDHRGVRRRRGEEGGQLVLVGQCRSLIPVRVAAQKVGRPQRDLLVFGHHGEEVAVAHHRDHAGQALRSGRCRCRAASRPRRRADHPAVHHAVERQVVHVARPARAACQGGRALRRWCRRRGSPTPASAPLHRWRLCPAGVSSASSQ